MTSVFLIISSICMFVLIVLFVFSLLFSATLFVCLSVCLFVCLSCLSVCPVCPFLWFVYSHLCIYCLSFVCLSCFMICLFSPLYLLSIVCLFVFCLFVFCLFVLFDDLFILTFVSTVYSFTYIRGRCGRYRMVVRLKTTYAISAYHLSLSISNPAQDHVYSIQPCVIKCVSGLLQDGRFHRIPRFILPIKLTPTISLKYFW